MSALNWRVLARQKPNDQIVLGMIGVGGQGTSRLRQFLSQPDVRIGAICDVDRAHADRAVAEVEKAGGHKPKVFGDFRRVLEDPEIDAVAIVTPDHWHALATVRAFEAGKDVFVEKPLSYSVAEGRMMADGSLKYKRVTQMGNHIHNDLPNYRRVVELVQSGKLGRITRAHCWKTGEAAARAGLAVRAGWRRSRQTRDGTADARLRFLAGAGAEAAVSSAAFARLVPALVGLLRRDVHRLLGAHLRRDHVGARSQGAARVTAVGGRFFVNDETETPDTLEALIEYPDLLAMFSLRPTPLPGFEHLGHIGCLFQGTDAWLATNYETNEVWVDGKKVEDFPRPAPTIPDSPGHIREFLDAIKTRNLETTCNVRYGHRVTKPGLLSNISYRTGRRIQWDDEKERVIDDNDANRYLSRRFRKDYKL